MTGRLDLAILYDRGPIRGVDLEPLYSEPLALLTRRDDDRGACSLADVAAIPLVLPGPTHTLRQVVTDAFEQAGVLPRVVAEVESVGLVQEAIAVGLGATLLPRSLARRVAEGAGLAVSEVTPAMEMHMSLGTPAALPQSPPAKEVQRLLREILSELVPRWSRGRPDGATQG